MSNAPPLLWPLGSSVGGGPAEAALQRAVAACGAAPEDVHAAGALAALERPALGLFCSARCPGGAILRALDLAHALRDAGVPVVSGFHSPVERECLRLLLRGSQPVIVCLARDMARMRIPPEWRGPLADGRLLLLSASGGGGRRATAHEAERRNRFVAALAAASLVAYAAPGSKTEALARWIAARGQPLATVDDSSAAGLVAQGATPLRPETLAAWWDGVVGQRRTQP
jgi:predicted Rossmann fold nucleotide-binding protein DprA/Smf involved in DNA uptake